MSIQNIDPGKVQIIQSYLEQEFHGCRIHNFFDGKGNWQTYLIKFDDVSDSQLVSVSYDFFRDVPDILATIQVWHLADSIYNANWNSLIVTSKGVEEHANTLRR